MRALNHWSIQSDPLSRWPAQGGEAREDKAGEACERSEDPGLVAEGTS